MAPSLGSTTMTAEVIAQLSPTWLAGSRPGHSAFDPLPVTERQALTLPHLSQADRLAVFHINQRRKKAFKIIDTPKGTRLEAGPYIGVFRLATFTVQVKPKAGVGTRNLLFMLARTMGRQWALPPASMTVDSSDLQEELLALFVRLLGSELRRGLMRRSQTVQEDLPVLRGRLRVAAYLRRGDPSRLPVEFADLTANHPVNRLFLLVLEQFLGRVQGRRLRQQVAELRVWLREAGVSPWPAPPRDWAPFTLNRLQRRYDPALTLARILLDGQGTSQDAGQFQGHAFAFDMDRLYERFLTRVLLDDVLPGTGYEGRAQRPHDQPEHLFEGGVQELLPDLTVLQDGQVRLIIDFKNKVPGAAHSGSDLYQMYSYARHLNCERVLLLYPGPVSIPVLQAAGGGPLQVSAAGVDLTAGLPENLPALHDQLRTHLRGQGLQL